MLIILPKPTEELDDEPEDQELEAHYMYMAKIQEVTLNIADNFGPISNVESLQKRLNVMIKCFKERELLASLVEQMKIEIDTSKQNNKALESSSKALKEANTFLERVIPTTSVSIPQLKSNRLEDRVVYNNIQGKKHEVEDHSHRDNSIHCRLWVLKARDSKSQASTLSPDPQSQVNVPQAAETVPTSFNELDMLFSLMLDEYFTGATTVV
nr:hypothetical protein [Tanacetum cinerariifolium]